MRCLHRYDREKDMICQHFVCFLCLLGLLIFGVSSLIVAAVALVIL